MVGLVVVRWRGGGVPKNYRGLDRIAAGGNFHGQGT